MASESLTPPPASGGGYAKYLVVLLLVLGGGLGVFFATRKEPEPPKPAPAIKNAERPTALAQPTIEIPPDEPEPEDAAVPPEPEKKPVRTGGGDPWSCSGDIDVAAFRQVVADHQTAIRSCYERKLRNDNTLQGDVQLQVRIGNDGRVTATRVGGNMRDNEVKSCIQNIAKSWSMPAPSGGSCAIAGVPFKFTPKQ